MKSETKLFIGIILGTIALVVAGVFFLSHSSTPTKADTSLLIRADSDKISTPSATVTLVEFGDFQCPACGDYHPVVKQVLSDFQKNITFVFRNFPLDSIHPNAHPAALAAEAAGIQGKYWEMHDMLYEHQVDWADKQNPQDVFNGYATSLGLNLDQFKKDINSSGVVSKVQEDMNDGNALAINQTPTFFVNGTMIENPASLADFEKVIKTAMK